MPKQDFAQIAHRVYMQSTGQADAPPEERYPDPAAAELGAKGGKARAAKLTPERRSEIAKKAVAARWAKEKASKPDA